MDYGLGYTAVLIIWFHTRVSRYVLEVCTVILPCPSAYLQAAATLLARRAPIAQALARALRITSSVTVSSSVV